MSQLKSSVVVSLAILAAFIGRIAQAAVNASAVAPDLVKNSALAWYDAADDSTITADANGVVSAWADKSGNNRTATARADTSFWSAPVRTTAFGCPCLDFGLVGRRRDLVYTRMTSIRTVFLVGRFAQEQRVFLLGDDKEYHFHRGVDGYYFDSDYAKHSRVWNGLDEVATPGATRIHWEKPQFIACEMSQNCCSDTLTNDRDCNGTTRNGGRHLFEVIVFDRVLTDDERSAVMTYLQTKWRFDPPPAPRRSPAPTLVARYDFNNYDPANPTSADILVDSVSGAVAKPAQNPFGKGTTAITDGTLGSIYAVTPNYAGADDEARTCAASLATGNYALAIPLRSHLQIPVPSELVGRSTWTMRIRFWSPAASHSTYRCFFNEAANADDGNLFIRNKDNLVGLSGYGGNAVTPCAWHTMVLSVGPTRSDAYLDGVHSRSWNDAHWSRFFTENQDFFIFCGDENGEDNLLYIDYLEFYADGGAVEAKGPGAAAGLLGEWRFSGTGDDRLKATVGTDLTEFVRDKDYDIDLSRFDGVLSGDGYARAGQNNGFKCYHNLPKNSSYTVVMDVRVPFVSSKEWYALFQPLAANNGDCRYYLCPNGDGLRLWVASSTYTGNVAVPGEWIRVVITYANDGDKVIYVNGAKIDNRRDANMKITDDHFYFLVENSGEDNTTDISYAALYDRVLSDGEIATYHSRSAAHDADGKQIVDVPPTAHWVAEDGGWTAVKGQPLTEEANGLVWTRTEAAPAEATYIMDVTLPDAQTTGGALVANANNIASGVYGTSNVRSGSFKTDGITSFLSGDPQYGDWGYWTYNTLERGLPHRVAVSWTKEGTVAYYVDGRRWCQLDPGNANTAAKPTQTMRFLTDSGATATMIAAYDRALTDEEIASIGLSGRPSDPKTAPAVTLAADKTEAKASVDTFTFTITASSTDDERVSYQIDYGDGVVETTSAWEPMAPKAFTHVYGEVGEFTAKAKVFTFSGAVAEATVTVTTVAATKPAAEVVKIAPWQQNVYTNRFTVMFESASEQPGIELQYGADYAQRVPMTGVQDNGGFWLYKATATVEGQEGEEIPYRLGFFGLSLTDDAEGVSSGAVRLWADGEADFSCAVWGDNQEGSRAGDWDSDKYAYVSALFRHMIARDVDFGLSTGDMASTGDYASQIAPLVLERTNEIFGRYKPYYVAFGNHDGSYPVNRTYFETPAANDPDYAATYVSNPGRGNSYLYRNNVLFVLIDQALQGDGGTKTWLANLLATDRAKAAKFRVVLHHYPFYGECWGSLSAALVDICKAGNVDLVLSGHMHGYERIEKNGILQVTNGGAGYLDHVESIVNNYGADIKVGGHRNVPYLWARQKSKSETDVLGGAEPVRMGCIQSYGEISVKGGELTYTAHGFDANGDYIGVFDTFAITSKTAAVAAPASAAPSTFCENPESFAEFTAKPVSNAKWAEYKAAVGEAFAYPDGAGSRPVVNVSRTEIERFLVWLNGETGDYRLPTVGELEAAFGGELRREVAEWTSSVDPNTGWCRILGSPAKSVAGTWMRTADKPSIATPGCHADYLGFRLSTDPAPVEPVDALAAPLAALAEFAEPSAVYKWENGALVDISGEWASPSGDLVYDAPVIVTGAGDENGVVAFDFGEHSLALNGGLAAPNCREFLKSGAGALTVKGTLFGGITDSEAGWKLVSDGTLAFDGVTYRGENFSPVSGDRMLTLAGVNDFSASGLTINSVSPTNFVAAVAGAEFRLFKISQRDKNTWHIGEGLTVTLRDELTCTVDLCAMEVDGVLDIGGYLVNGNYYAWISGTGTVRAGYLKNCDNSWAYLAISNIVMTTGDPFRAKKTRSYDRLYVEGCPLRMVFEQPWTFAQMNAEGKVHEIHHDANKFPSPPRLILDGAADGTFSPNVVNANVTVEKAGTGTLTVTTSQNEPFEVSGGTVRLEDGVALGSEANHLAAGATLQLAAQSGLVRMTSEGGTLALAPGVTRATLPNGSQFTGPVALAEGVEKLALGYVLPTDNPTGVYQVLVDSGLKAEQIDLTCAVPEGYQSTTIVSAAGDVTLVVLSEGKTISEWTGAGDSADPSDPRNWQDGKVPDGNAYVLLSSPVVFTLPSTARLPMAGFLVTGRTLELGADCDWRATGDRWTTDFEGVTIDLKGHDLRLAAPDGSFSGSLTITDTTSEDPGGLHMEVADGETFTNSGLTLAGNVRFVKDGEGVLVTGNVQSSNVGGWEIASGTVKPSGSVRDTKPFGEFGSTVTVRGGATYDLNGQYDSRYYDFILDGGTLANRGGNVGPRYGCMGKITLTRDSSLDVTSDFPIWDKIDLNGYNLDIAIHDSRTLAFFKSGDDVSAGCSLTNGTVNITSGGWLQPYAKVSGDAIDARTVDFTVNAAFSLEADIHVRNLTMKYGLTPVAGNGRVYIHGVFTPSIGDYVNHFLLQDGATLNLSDREGVYDIKSSQTGQTLGFADGATIGVKFGAKRSGMVVAWKTRPDASVNFVAVDEPGCKLVVKDDGLYTRRGLNLIIR